MLLLSLISVIAFDGPPLEVPWKCGDVRPCTQAHGGFSHTDDSYWAWDFDFTVGEEVLAASAGTVSHIQMGQPEGGCDPAFANAANYVVVDHGDGTSASYLHLLADSSPLQVGDAVVPGMLIGRVGLSGYVCGDHLHFQVQTNCGSWFCPTVPAEFIDYGDPVSGQQIESTNCPECALQLDGGVTLISELDPGCFTRQTRAWWSTMEGDDDHHFYTIATDAGVPESIGTWWFGVNTPGQYRVEVFVPEQDADAQGAVYQVHHAGGMETIPVDQSASKGWQELGVFEFVGGTDERIELPDNTGEALDLQRHLAFDAVRLSFVPGEGSSSGGGTSDGDSAGSTGVGDPTGDASGTPSTSGSGTASGPGSETSSASGGGTETDGLPGTFGERGEADDGCACAVRGQHNSSWGLVGLVALLGLRRRRWVR